MCSEILEVTNNFIIESVTHDWFEDDLNII